MRIKFVSKRNESEMSHRHMIQRTDGVRRRRSGNEGRLIVRKSLGISALVSGIAISSLAYGVQDLVVGDNPPEDTVLFSADRVSRDHENAPIMAEGNVRAFFGDRSLVAEKVTYDPTLDIVTATGNVSIFDEEGQSYHADSVELTGDLRDGVASNFATLLEKQNRLAGSSTVRRSSGQNDVNNAVYSACSVCNDEGKKTTPTWQVKALRVTQDTNDQVIRFRNAAIFVKGIPLIYTPYLEFPDPSLKRKSGFLTPNLGNSTRAGFEIEVPYYWAISDYQDATFYPRHFEKLGTLVKSEYRVRRHNSGLVVQGGAIDPKGIIRDTRDRDLIEESLAANPTERLFVPSEFRDTDIGPRWHLFASGFMEFENDWQAELDIDYVSDKQYLRTYDVQPEGSLREAIDVLQPDRLENEFSLVRRTNDTYTDISAISFQSLRARDDNDFIADALPRLRHEKRLPVPRIGGDLTYQSDFLHLHRPDGLDSTRAVLGAKYEKQYTTKNGHRFRGFAELRGDYYLYNDANLGVERCNVEHGNFTVNDNPNSTTCREILPRQASSSDADYNVARVLPTVGVEWSYPIAKFTENTTIILEPKVQLAVSPNEDYTDDIYNEDSGFFQFDAVTLFDWNKAPGLDQWEDGQRLNVGVSGTAVLGNKLKVDGMIGQQFRTNNATEEVDISQGTIYDIDSGLGDTKSDYVGEFDLQFGKVLSADNSFRFDKDNFTLRRAESNLRGRVGKVSTSLSYLRVETPSDEGQRDEFLTASASYQVNKNWVVGGNTRENLESGETTSQSLFLRYRDDCTIFSVNYRFDNTEGNNFDFNRSFTFNVDLIGF